MALERKEILVYAHWDGIESPFLMGSLYATPSRGKEIFSFEYDKGWLRSDYAQIIDPDLQLFEGAQYLNDEKSNFGIFLDSSPDRWGRVLMMRKEAAKARKEERRPKTLMESDYLLGVYDNNRMGGLRFKTAQDGAFLDDDETMAAPPFAALRDLEFASLQLEKEDALDNPEYLKWLNMLMAPGSSLGGARPKANIKDIDGDLWIAKFPSQNDRQDMGAWEMLAYRLAIQSGIEMAPSRVQKFSHHQHTFLTQRFDRKNDGTRIHFASAMTLLGYTDGTDYQDGVSYLELLEFLMQNGADVENDLRKLWRRIAFNVCISNTDDHLRNHGFLLTDSGWILSPAYDINPTLNGTGLKLNISENDNALDLDLVREVAPYFRLKEKEANAIINKIQQNVAQWEQLATDLSIPRNEMELMKNAFKH
ncbi:serine/threonine-protein kinase HipA [Salegentibacter agarivorans]|uniref:Serine/threonine-protein kinase HipA n=1 Tax=Salegentibacter agarivorans TaxID=345907 RepID=A0A1I2NV46_9FLAO|nr:HipA domain-containing protein [Salegentibacter agarivorans]SFG05111.1 serine/threonine-protein kinase HipA [Salegentibacter agarivorans]|tara:strand:- start:505 stop:1767 length:1263 start_codon:yes stop_codon:yes gene_type:complete